MHGRRIRCRHRGTILACASPDASVGIFSVMLLLKGEGLSGILCGDFVLYLKMGVEKFIMFYYYV